MIKNKESNTPGRLIIRDRQFFSELKVASMQKGFKRIEDYIKTLHSNTHDKRLGKQS